jgi:hypothetical protein
MFLLFAIHLGPLGIALLTAVGFLVFGMAFEPQDVLDIRNLAIAPNKQNAFLTPVAAASYTQRPRNPGNYNPVHTPSFYTDGEMANKGHQ